MMENKHLGNDLRRKAVENSKPLHASGRSIAFSIETICTVLLLFVTLAVVVQFLGGAFVATRHANGEMTAVVTARQVAEEFQGASSPEQFAQAIGGKYDASTGEVKAQVEFVRGQQLPVTVTLAPQPYGAGTLYNASIAVGSEENPSTMFTLDTSHYVKGGA